MAELIKVYDHSDHLNNVITALSTDVSEVIYFTRVQPFKRQAQALKNILKKNGIGYKIVKLKDDAYIDTVLDEHPHAYIDISSSRYLSYHLFEKALNHKGTILYYDQYENVIKDYRQHCVFTDEIYTLSIKEMIELAGGKLEGPNHKIPNMKDTDYTTRIKKVMTIAIKDYRGFTSFISKVAQILKSEISVPIDKETAKTFGNHKYYMLLKSHGILSIDNGKLITTKRYKQLLSNVGSWLESYLYITIKESGYFDDCVMTATIDFGAREDIHPVICEIDGIIAKDNRTAFVSCKSNKVDTSALNEIKVHRHMFGGAFSKAVVMTAEDLMGKSPPTYEKAQELGVAVIDKPAIVKNEVADVLKKVLDGTYTYERLR